ncbi:probable iron-sulfur protein (2Fe-2S) [Natronomonas pharaonis DSM 2160]|uniref:Probable iron-sulfur protein (2Fe-2S) n=1 Tax=Natronomonas pharaonis (strain ATCC 35678 / DSM 2160 / CIP 103997 / JCM 8858 / NBRC 14720 / NCIMB 2260 / Gabara) TaxID=348780 RepID=A0A1U7EVF9_NATPD|nr:Rieske 2Fe-2S domain-containing protein [Natronomonas pharaonis]CAI49008.1 probable iron-sulfur protein (2Fe-2S) [Natronomonas pharaonis DSM 2160]
MVRYRLTDIETVREEGVWLFTGRVGGGEEREIIVVPCEDDSADSDVEAWENRCTHEDQRLYREDVGAVVRDGSVVCPKHGSAFDSCSGGCDNGPAAGSTLPSVDVAAEDGQVYLTDDNVSYIHAGPSDDDDDDEPGSTSHLRF